MSDKFEVTITPEEQENPYITRIVTKVLPVIRRQTRFQQRFQAFKQGVKSAAKNVAIGFAVAAVALASAHVVGIHLMGLHMVRTAHVLFDVAMGFGAVSLGAWIDEKTTPKEIPQQITEKEDKKVLRKSMPELSRESDGRDDTSFSFKSFFTKIRRSFSSPALIQTASSDHDINRFDGKR